MTQLSFINDEEPANPCSTCGKRKYKENCLERRERENSPYNPLVMRMKQQLPYEVKVVQAQLRAREFYNKVCGELDANVHVSVGGLDSITLLKFLREVCRLDVPAVSVSSLEDVSIQAVHKEMGVIRLKPSCDSNGKPWTKAPIIQEYGFRFTSKEKAAKIVH